MPSEVAEKLIGPAKSIAQPLKRGVIFKDLTARLNVAPLPILFEPEFFRSLFQRAGQGLVGHQA